MTQSVADGATGNFRFEKIYLAKDFRKFPLESSTAHTPTHTHTLLQ